MTDKKLILLDLNYTLVSNSEIKIKPFINQIQNEEYRTDLIELIKNHIVFLITARPVKYETVTIERIKLKTGWNPDLSFFNSYNLPPPILKEKILKERILFGERNFINNIIAIESNPRTRTMYKKYNIKSYTYSEIINNKELLYG